MVAKRELEQHVAVFGESMSGKTVLLSSFYGATQESSFLKESHYNVVADDIGQGSRLHRNYLKMRREAKPPDATAFSPTTYRFSVKLKDNDAGHKKDRAFDVLRLVWHDYPGEWFESGTTSNEESERRVDTFRTLLKSDVAILLIDAQRLIENEGEEERYLKSLFSNFRNGLLTLRDDILQDDHRLLQFPRIWVLALSKADLLPNMDVFAFRDLVIEKAADDLDEFRKVLASFVTADAAISVGEDYALLSSAKFEPGRIELEKRVGVDLLLPLATVLPLERQMRWAAKLKLPQELLDSFLSDTAPVALELLGIAAKNLRWLKKFPGKFSSLTGILAALPFDKMIEAAQLGGVQLKERNRAAMKQQDTLGTVMTEFKLALDEAENNHILHRSR
jgi:hypothetical protein